MLKKWKERRETERRERAEQEAGKKPFRYSRHLPAEYVAFGRGLIKLPAVETKPLVCNIESSLSSWINY